MEVSDDDEPVRKKQRNEAANEEKHTLKQENDSLRCQVEAYKNEASNVISHLTPNRVSNIIEQTGTSRNKLNLTKHKLIIFYRILMLIIYLFADLGCRQVVSYINFSF